MSQNFLSVYAKSFNWAGFFLPKKTYKQCSDLYDFCRTLDDIADQDLDLEIKKKLTGGCVAKAAPNVGCNITTVPNG